MKFVKLHSVELLKLNLQLFAEGEPGDGGGDGSGDGQDTVTFASQSDFDKEVDKRIANAIETAQSKWKSDTDQKIADAKSEGERLAQMNEEERTKAEKQKQDDALAKREADITRRELRAQSLEQLAEKSLPKELIDVVVLTDADSCSKSIEAIEKSFQAAVEDAVNARLVKSAGAPGLGGNIISSEKGSTGKRLAEANNKQQKESKYFKN